MPEKWIVDYYNQVADKILPFLKDRNTDVNQIFDSDLVFRRHNKDGKTWIRINSQKDLRYWTDWHAWSFYPHLEGDRDAWFALDVDPNKMDFDCVKIASLELADIFDDLKIKYLVKFSGNKGFHFLFSLGDIKKELPGEKLWQFERRLVSFLRDELEQKLQQNSHRDKFYRLLKKDDPILIDRSTEEKKFNSILLDKLILHEKANIRAPYSLHEKTKLVSLPIKKEKIIGFNPEKDADPQNASRFQKFTMPKNNLFDIIKLIG